MKISDNYFDSYRLPAVVSVSSKGLAHLGDQVHFSAEAQRELGQRFAEGMHAARQAAASD